MTRALFQDMEWRTHLSLTRYDISEHGDVRTNRSSSTRKVWHRPRGSINGDGYVCFGLITDNGGKCTRTAHRLVADCFLPPKPFDQAEIAHGDGSRFHNHYKNLRWATRAENHQDAVRHQTTVAGERNGRARLSSNDVDAIRADYVRGQNGNSAELSARYGISQGHISRIARGKAWMESF